MQLSAVWPADEQSSQLWCKQMDMTMLGRAAARLMLQRKAVSDHVLGIKPGLHPKLPDGGFLTTQVGS